MMAIRELVSGCLKLIFC